MTTTPPTGKAMTAEELSALLARVSATICATTSFRGDNGSMFLDTRMEGRISLDDANTLRSHIDAQAAVIAALKAELATAITPATIARQHTWSQRTFGTHTDTVGNCKHIERELVEARANPSDAMEWIDIAMLAFDGALRNGHHPKAICAAYGEKLAVNEARKWGPKIEGQPIEHVRGQTP